jgi:hypothetical protein
MVEEEITIRPKILPGLSVQFIASHSISKHPPRRISCPPEIQGCAADVEWVKR